MKRAHSWSGDTDKKRRLNENYKLQDVDYSYYSQQSTKAANASEDVEMVQNGAGESIEMYEESESSEQQPSNGIIQQNPLVIGGVIQPLTDFYVMEESTTRKNDKFSLTHTAVTIRFTERANSTSNITELFDMVIVDVIRRLRAEGTDKVGFSIIQQSGTKAMHMPIRKIEDVRPEVVRREFTMSENSTGVASALIADKLEMKMTFVKTPAGSGKKSFAALEDDTNITKIFGDKYCLSKAIAFGLAYLAKDEDKLNSLRRYPSKQEEAAEELCSLLRMPFKERSDLEDVKRFQEKLPGVQLVVFNGDRSKRCLFRGPYVDDQHVLGIILHNEHFEHIKKVSPFLSSIYYCAFHNMTYKTAKDHYNCKFYCRRCGLRNTKGCEEGKDISCQLCHQSFHSMSCFDQHKKKGERGGKSMCESTDVCHKCGVVKHEQRKGRPHKCNHVFCHDCQCDRPRDHGTCFIGRTKKPKNVSTKTIVFDMETVIVEQEDGSHQHLPCLIHALRSCEHCKNKDETVCNQCGGEKHWEADTCDNPSRKITAEFVKFLTLPVNKGLNRFVSCA